MGQGPIHVGIIGTGNIGKMHLMSIAALRESNLLNVKVSALCDTDKESLHQAAEFFDVSNTYDAFEDLINDDMVDIIYICTPTNKHADMVKSAAGAKKPIFCEKPLAHSCPQARELLAVTKDANVCAGVGLVLRYDQFLLHAKNLVETRDFGKPMLAHIRDDQRFPVDYVYYSKWRGDKSIAGGGTLIEHSIHDLDILRWFFGDVENVFAKVGFFAEREVEDQASLILTHKNGAVSTLDSIWHWVERPNERRIEFFYEKGYIGINLESGDRYLEYQLQGEESIRVSKENANESLIKKLDLHARNISPEAVETITAFGTERYSALSYSMLKAFQLGTTPSPDFVDAVEAHKIVDAAYESANRGIPVCLL
jgi:UDP-N-acetyl-2-amino-2-deoxyglucuronate dehydrogenase